MDSSNDYPKHAWFSQKAKDMNLHYKVYTPEYRSVPVVSNIYQHIDGHNIECTMVSNDPNSEYNWDDKKYLGLVTKWISSNKS